MKSLPNSSTHRGAIMPVLKAQSLIQPFRYSQLQPTQVEGQGNPSHSFDLTLSMMTQSQVYASGKNGVGKSDVEMVPRKFSISHSSNKAHFCSSLDFELVAPVDTLFGIGT
jgi:hypothetical protein